MLDTNRQVAALKRCGLETEATDKVMGHLAGLYPDRFQALSTALERAEL